MHLKEKAVEAELAHFFPKEMSSNPSLQSLGNQMSSAFSSFTKSLKPLGSEINKSFSQAQQYAKEKIGGNGADTTELPSEYRALEEKVLVILTKGKA